jgi:large conductance mechanosensitive channel
MFRRSFDFISKGGFLHRASIFELGIALGITYAVQRVMSGFITDILMPLVGAITGGLWFGNFFVPLSGSVTATTLEEAKSQGAILAYGSFASTVINFLLVLFVSVLVLRVVNRITGRKVLDDH